ncbi:MAG TPA: hypothetical protein VGR21_12725, partial [Cryptosporangiaceae bacterium]|nr:hypothetical protein [Cryptosporangiaceae bacterium]
EVAGPGADTVPGFPESSLADESGPWHRAWPDAEELGASREEFWGQLAGHGLRVPTAWLGTGSWSTLWSRAAHRGM